jgi:hypothetical protein
MSVATEEFSPIHCVLGSAVAEHVSVQANRQLVSNRTDMYERNDLSLGFRAARDTTEHRPLRTIASSSAPSAALFREGRRRRDGATGTTAKGLLLMHNGAHMIG